jgi:hypothetical protein
MNLEGKTALITGGSKGIGYGIAQAMLEQGIKVAITSRTQAGADAATEELKKIGKGQILGFASDVRSLESQQSVADELVNKWGGIDVVIANAGLGHFGSVEDITAEQWVETIGINLTGAFFTLKSTIPALKKSKGYYITISSLAGTNFFAGGAAYNASKFGLTGFTQAAMLDLRQYGIKMTTIMPGSVATYFNNHTPAPTDAWKIQIEDLGQMVIDLLNMHPRTLPSKIEVRPSTPPSR